MLVFASCPGGQGDIPLDDNSGAIKEAKVMWDFNTLSCLLMFFCYSCSYCFVKSGSLCSDCEKEKECRRHLDF